MKTTHTQGPWEITLDARNALGFIRPATPELSTPIATIHYADSGASDANARLIASAPDLLDALKRLLAAHDADVAHGFESLSALVAGGNGQAADQARAAIAKATRA